MKRDAFSQYHPFVNFLYFLLVLAFSMFLMHPVCLILSLAAALCYCLWLKGGRALGRQLRFLIPMLLLTVCLNPLFNHEGATILAYLPNGNPLTREAIFYGIAASVMLVVVILWFSCLNAVITSDKLIYLFGRIIPALSLLLSMLFRFIPRLRAHMQEVSETQRAAGQRPGLRLALTVFSATVTWSMENAIDTADSMKSRGYGLPGRTAFSIYRFTRRDAWALGTMVVLTGCVLAGIFLGGLDARYYPTASFRLTPFTACVCLCQLCLYGIPLILGICEDLKWNCLTSNL